MIPSAPCQQLHFKSGRVFTSSSKVEETSSSETTPSESSSEEHTDGEGTITVHPGEGEAALAQRAGISIAQLEALNPSHMSSGSWFANPGDVIKTRQEQVMKTIQIAIDGPASSGKSTVAKIIAKDFGYTYLDTGAMYRAATYIALKHQLDAGNVDQLLELLNQHPISFGRSETGEQLVFVGDVDITHPIRENEVTNKVSSIAAIPEVREKLVSLQQEIAQQGGIVMDGRDIGTVVLPQAELKIFLVASVEERAERRYKENIAKGIETDLETLKEEIAARDYKDSHRETSPLKQAEDAVYLDTTGLSIQEVVEKIESEAKKRMSQ